MTALIIFIICLIISVVACVWCRWDQNRIMARFNKPTKKTKKQAKVVKFKIDEMLALELDEKLSLTHKEMKK